MLIAPRVVLTAGHCVAAALANGKSLCVVAGPSQLRGSRYAVQGFRLHPDFSDDGLGNLQNDIAVLLINAGAPDSAVAADAPVSPSAQGSMVRVVGFGRSAGGTSASQDGVFTTGNWSPVLPNIAIAPTTTAATVSWVTDQPSTSTLYWRIPPNGNSSTTTDGTGTSHALTATGLTPSTTYSYFIVAVSSPLVGGCCQTQRNDATFQTRCQPTTCAAQGKTCGTIPDGCGGTLSCGSCASGFACGSSNTCISVTTTSNCWSRTT